jgi:hypothetical protein
MRSRIAIGRMARALPPEGMMKLDPCSILAAGVALFALAGGGCSNHDNGTIVQNWTIEGTTNTNACVVHGANQMRVVVLNPQLVVQATQFSACDAFSTSFSVPQDIYTTSATFLDVNGAPVSKTLTLPSFNVNHDETVTVTTDFPVNAFPP